MSNGLMPWSLSDWAPAALAVKMADDGIVRNVGFLGKRANNLCIISLNFFPRVRNSIARINAAAVVEYEEESGLAAVGFFSCAEDAIVFGKFDRVVEGNGSVVWFGHDVLLSFSWFLFVTFVLKSISSA